MNKKFLPIFLFFVWILLCTIHAFFLHLITQFEWQTVIVDSLIYNFIYAILAGGIWFALRFEKNNNSIIQNIATLHLPMLTIITTLWIFTGKYLTSTIINSEKYVDFNAESLKYRIIIGVFLFSIIIIFYYLIKYYNDIEERKLKNINLEKELQRSKFDFLQVQIQPHFLFNALNSIASLTYENPDTTRKMIVKLSEFLRYTTKYNDKNLVPLSDELSHIDKYLDIEILRFGERLNYEKHIQEKTKTLFLPTLILQPLIENAIKHGVNKSINKVTISLSTKIVDTKLLVTVSNNKDQTNDTIGTNTGLKNLTKRLQIIYGEDANVEIKNTTDNFTISLLIPQQKN